MYRGGPIGRLGTVLGDRSKCKAGRNNEAHSAFRRRNALRFSALHTASYAAARSATAMISAPTPASNARKFFSKLATSSCAIRS